MGAGDDRRPTLQQIPDGGQGRHNALVAGDGAGGLILWDVEVTAQQDLLPRHVYIHDGLFIVVHIGRLLYEK